MPPTARASGTDVVFSRTGTGRKCRRTRITATAEGSPDAFLNGHPFVREGDLVATHPKSGCSPDLSGLTTYSNKVFVNGKGVARIGDEYTPDNIITTGSGDVFCG